MAQLKRKTQARALKPTVVKPPVTAAGMLAADIGRMLIQLMRPARKQPGAGGSPVARAPEPVALKLTRRTPIDQRVRLKTLQSGACVAWVRQGGGPTLRQLERALKDADEAVRLADQSAQPELKCESRVVRAAVQHTLAPLEPESTRALLNGALDDLNQALRTWRLHSAIPVAPVHAERAQVLRALAMTGGTTQEALLEESLKEYQTAIESFVTELDTRPPSTAASDATTLVADETPWVSDVLDVRRSFELTRAEFAPLLGYSERTLASWEVGEKRPKQEVMRRYEELRRLHQGLGSIMREQSIPVWLKHGNPAFGNRPPLELIREGRSDQLWQVIFQLQSSPAS